MYGLGRRMDKLDEYKIPIYVGDSVDHKRYLVDLETINHLLICGVPGSGKSTLIHNIIHTIATQCGAESIKFLLIDGAGIELPIHNVLPHLLVPAITDPTNIQSALDYANHLIDLRFNALRRAGVRSVKAYNKLGNKMVNIVVIYDGCFFESHKYSQSINNILINGRQAGLHMILSTSNLHICKELLPYFPAYACFRMNQRPPVIQIKDNMVSSLRLYELLYLDNTISEPVKLCVPDFSDLSTQSIKEESQNQYCPQLSLKTWCNSSTSETRTEKDEFFWKAANLILDNDKASIGMLQRKFKIGFNRATRLMDQLAEAGIVGPDEGACSRKILVTTDDLEKIKRKEREKDSSD